MASPPSFRLLDLMQRRRRLPAEAVVQILHALPAILESPSHLDDQGDALLARIAVQIPDLDSFPSLREIMDADPAQWPPFALELTAEIVPPQSTDRTFAPALARRSRVASLAALLLELLGGARRDATGGAVFSPVASLNSEANDLLHAALDGRAGTNCVTFWETWLRAGAFSSRLPAQRLEPSPAPADTAQATGTVLDLTPTGQPHPTVRLCSCPEFRIGRSELLADFSIHAGVARSSEISRVHAFAEWHPSGLTLRDGDGAKPSGNGSSLDGQPLDAVKPRPLDRRGILLLGGFYRLEIVPVIHQGAISAVRLIPPARDPVQRNAAWIFSFVPFGLRDGQFDWVDSASAAAGTFTYHEERFSLHHLGGPGEWNLNGAPILPGEEALLVDGAMLSLDGYRFRLSLR